MGFYAPAQIVRDAIDHGVEVRPVDVNASRWDCTLEPTDTDGRMAVRLGFRLVAGLRNEDGAALAAARMSQSFADVNDVWRRSAVQVSSLVRLAEADAFGPSMGLARRDALWAIKALRDNPLPLFTTKEDEQPVPEVNEMAVRLKAMTPGHEVVEDYAHVGLTLRSHPVSFLRPGLTADKTITCADANARPDRRKVTTAGLVLVRQRPGSAKGVMFITIEDETGTANLVIWPSLYEKQRQIVHGAHMLAVEGHVQREGLVVHIVANKLIDLSDKLAGIGETEDRFLLPHGRGDEFHHGGNGPDSRDRPPRKVRDIYVPDLHIDTMKLKPRNFR
jgi:error-prone DNA polymerase